MSSYRLPTILHFLSSLVKMVNYNISQMVHLIIYFYFLEATLQQNSQELFNEAVLNTPLIQDEQENPLKEYFQ